MTQRRDALKHLAAAGGAGVLAAMPQHASAGISEAKSMAPKFPPKARPNIVRARQLMEAQGVEAIICLQNINTLYLTGYSPLISKMGFMVPGIAILPRDETRPLTHIVPAVDLWMLANENATYAQQIIPYTAPVNPEDLKGPDYPEAWPAQNQWPVYEPGLSPRERQWMENNLAYRDKAVPDAAWGLVKALKDLGLSRATVATDDIRLDAIIQANGLEEVTCRKGDNLMRRIRMVKTATELEVMKWVGTQNAAAADATMRQLELGATITDIEHIFRNEAAQRGTNSVFILAGSLGQLPHEELIEGAPILIDAVSEHQGYHGDYGRTFIIGEAPFNFERHTKALQVAWEAAFEILRPGIRYSQIQETAQEAVRKSGLAERLITVNPHSVGMQHTDEPSANDLPGFVKDDHVLDEGMTITVDLPHLSPGWGACHLEDLVQITKDGAVPLHSMANPVMEV